MLAVLITLYPNIQNLNLIQCPRNWDTHDMLIKVARVWAGNGQGISANGKCMRGHYVLLSSPFLNRTVACYSVLLPKIRYMKTNRAKAVNSELIRTFIALPQMRHAVGKDISMELCLYDLRLPTPSIPTLILRAVHETSELDAMIINATQNTSP